MTPIYLTKEELVEITGRAQPVSQYKWLRQNGFTVLIRADGQLLVSRAHFEIKMDGFLPDSKPMNYEPDFGAL